MEEDKEEKTSKDEPVIDLGLPKIDLGLPKIDLGLPKIDLGLPKIDLLKLTAISVDAMKNLQIIHDNIPSMIEPLKNLSITLSPSLEELAEQAKNITFSPSALTLDLDQLSTDIIETPRLITPIQKESEIIEKQNETMGLLNTIIEQLKENSKFQNNLLKEVFTMVRELKEEQRLEHPFVDKLYQMALEWGLDPIDPDKDK